MAKKKKSSVAPQQSIVAPIVQPVSSDGNNDPETGGHVHPPAAGETSRGYTDTMALFDQLLGEADRAMLKDFPSAQQTLFGVLKSIYGSDISLDEGRRTAWGKKLMVFNITLHPDSDSNVFVRLVFDLPPEFPKIGPTVAIEESQPKNAALEFSITNIVDTLKKSQAGDEFMVTSMLEEIRDKLTDISEKLRRNEQLPSLEQERARMESLALTEAGIKQNQELRQRQEADAVADARLAEEVATRQKRLHVLTSDHSNIDAAQAIEENYSEDCVVFDRDILYPRPNADVDLSFRAVLPLSTLLEREDKTVFLAQPQRNGRIVDLKLALKVIQLPAEFNDQEDATLRLQEIEDILREVKEFKHDAVVRMLDYKIELVKGHGRNNIRQLSILSDFATAGPLCDVLDLSISFSASQLRTYARSLLDALEYFDRQGYVHPAIHPHNILFFRNSDNIQVKLSDGYGSLVHSLMKPSKSYDLHGNWAPPETFETSPVRSNKTCIWELGIVLLRMAVGNQLQDKYTSPEDAVSKGGFTQDFDYLISKMCTTAARKRPSAFQTQSYQFFKGQEISVFQEEIRKKAPVPSLDRSQSTFESRWAAEWDPVAKLGKGGFGVVMKARNRLDGYFYAVKQLHCESLKALDEVWSEVRMLAQLNHSTVVRYFGAWSEDQIQDTTDSGTSNLVTDTRSFAVRTNSAAPPSSLFAGPSTGHDFMDPSLAQISEVEEEDEEGSNSSDDGNLFGYQSAPSASDEDSQALISEHEKSTERSDPFALQGVANGIHTDDMIEFDNGSKFTQPADNRAPSRYQSFVVQPGFPSEIRRTQSYYNKNTILYIQMELCETGTLHDMIRNGLPAMVQEQWRLFRHIVDGLDHIHSLGIVHRDLKPMNIFIDSRKMPKIGDFGLAAASQATANGTKQATHVAGPRSQGVGTRFYIAPEIENIMVAGTFSSKADMFALGIILFEMSYAFSTHSERAEWLEKMGKPNFQLPEKFEQKDYQIQGRLIMSLINQDPEKRPSTKELLLDPAIPESIEEETEQRFVQRLMHDDPENFSKVISKFTQKFPSKAQSIAYSYSGPQEYEPPDEYLLCSLQTHIAAVFRHHGAVQSSRSTIYPVEGHNTNSAKYLDSAGFAVQLPFDLTVPHARQLALQTPKYSKTFCFGSVFRQRGPGIEPLRLPEIDFDITSSGTRDLSFRDAQAIGIMDAVIRKLDTQFSRSFTIIVSHGDLLDLILQSCGVADAKFDHVKQELGSLNVSRNWKQVSLELRSPKIGLTNASVEALSSFDFTCGLQAMREKVLACLDKIGVAEAAVKALRTFNRLHEIDACLQRLNLSTPVTYAPLSCTAENLYRGSTMFKCVEKRARKSVMAGGRYDSLIRSFETSTRRSTTRAVGFRINLIDIANFVRVDASVNHAKSTKNKVVIPANLAPRVEVVVTSFDEAILHSDCVESCQNILKAGVSAEVSEHFNTIEELEDAYDNILNFWLVIIRATSGGQRVVKVRSPDREEIDTTASGLVETLSEEMGHKTSLPAVPSLKRARSSHGAGDRENVVVLTPEHRSKKINRTIIVEAARSAAKELAESMSSNYKVLAVDTDDETLQKLRNTRLADNESWRSLRHGVALNEREYIQEIQEQFQEWARKGFEAAFVCNYKTKACIYYDFGKL